MTEDVMRIESNPISEETFTAIRNIKKLGNELHKAISDLPKQGRYTSLAKTSLEESVMWAVKELTA